jgi:hypothetical protein
MLGDFENVLALSLLTLFWALVSSIYFCYPLALVLIGCAPVLAISITLSRAVGLW